MHISRQNNSGLTGRLLLLVTSDGANNGILLPADAVECAVDVTLGFRSADFSLAGNVLLLAGLFPFRAAGEIANRLDDSTLSRVEPARSFAMISSDNVRATSITSKETRTKGRCCCCSRTCFECV